jgi:phosphoglycerol transferase MdoB-like AlkP superfamily enzyme
MRRVYTNIYSALALQIGASFILLHLTRYVFFLLNKSYFPEINFSDWLKIIFGGMKFDLAAILYTNSIFILIQIIPFAFRHKNKYRKISNVIYLISNSLMLAFSIADMVYFKYTLRRSTWMIFKEFSNEGNIIIILLKSLLNYWYIIPIFLGFLLILILINRKITKMIAMPSQTPYLHIGNFFMLISIPVLFTGGVRGDFKYTTRPITMSNAGEYIKNPELIPLILNTPFCMLRTMQQKFYVKEEFFPEEEINKNFNPVQSTSDGKAFKYENVVIIILESFGRESVGFYNRTLANGSYKGYTPFLDSLIGEGHTNMHSFANGRKSIDALPSILMGIPAGEISYILTPYISNKTQSLPAILSKKGYTTAFFHGAPNGSMGFKALMNLIGVQKYYGMNEYGNEKDFDGTWGIWDEPFFQYTADQINGFKEPFISTVFSVTSHEPFMVPSKYKNKFPKGDHPLRETIGYTDMALKRFFEKAKTMKWFKNTLFVITGDHASVSYFPEYQTSWGYMSVPILFYHPSDSSLRKVEKNIAQQIDIMPSVLSYLHYEQPFVAFGENLFNPHRKNIAVNYHNGFQLFHDQYLLQINNKEATSMYDYINDPLLKINILEKRKPQKDSMQNTIKAFIQQYHNRLIDNKMTAE